MTALDWFMWLIIGVPSIVALAAIIGIPGSVWIMAKASP